MGGSVFEGVPALQHFSITPALNAYLAATQERRAQETHQQGVNNSAFEALGRLAVSADTPEKWGAFVDRVQARFPGADLSSYRDFSARDAALAEFDPYFSDRQEAQRLLGRALGGGGQGQAPQMPTPQAPQPQVRVPNTPAVVPAPQPTVPSQGMTGYDPGTDPDVTGQPAAPRQPRGGPLVNARGEAYAGPGAVSVPVNFRLTNDTMQGMTPQAMTMLGAAQSAAANAGLARIEVVGANDVGPRGHRSHMHGTEFDIVGYNADGSRWTTEQRVQVAEAARGAGGNRFGFYPGGSLHMGTGYPGAPQNVAWGPGGRLSGVPVSAFAPEEQEFVTSLRGGVSFPQVAQAGANMGISPQLADYYSVLGSPGFDQLSTAQQNFVVGEIERLSAGSTPPTYQSVTGPDGSIYAFNPQAGTHTLSVPGQPDPSDREMREDQNGVLRYVDTGLPVFPGVEGQPEGPDVEGESTLRKEFNALTGVFRDVYDSYQRIEASAEDPSAAGDLALIFNYMKILDPGSAVRETEFANAQNAAGVPDIVRAWWNRLLSGERLSGPQRDDFLDRARRLYEAKFSDYEARAQDYRGLAQQYGYDPTRIVPDRDFAPTYQTETTPPPALTIATPAPVASPPANTSVIPRQTAPAPYVAPQPSPPPATQQLQPGQVFTTWPDGRPVPPGWQVRVGPDGVPRPERIPPAPTHIWTPEGGLRPVQ